jgi:hypothetical protein
LCIQGVGGQVATVLKPPPQQIGGPCVRAGRRIGQRQSRIGLQAKFMSKRCEQRCVLRWLSFWFVQRLFSDRIFDRQPRCCRLPAASVDCDWQLLRLRGHGIRHLQATGNT